MLIHTGVAVRTFPSGGAPADLGENVVMWITSDERHLLAGYYHLINAVGEKKAYRISDLAPVLTTYAPCPHIKEYGESIDPSTPARDVEEVKAQISQLIHAMNRIENGTKLDFCTFP